MAERPFIYAFEEISEDLPRPPFAALRALQSLSYLVSPPGWRELPVEARQAITREGARDDVGGANLQAAVKLIPLRHVKMMPKWKEPDPHEVPPELLSALGPLRGITSAEWGALRALDRSVLTVLVRNTRLLSRAVDEILPSTAGKGARSSSVVARCEITVQPDVLHKVLSTDLQDGRAFVLARVAGRRAARRVAEIFDLQADSTVGPIELDWGTRDGEPVIFWQAHASAWDGSFFPSAALLAATTAAIAVHDMIREIDPTATLGAARIRDEPWEAGRGELQEPTTALYGNLGPILDSVRGKKHDATLVTPPPDMGPDSVPRAPTSSPVLPRERSSVPSLHPSPPSSGRPLTSLLPAPTIRQLPGSGPSHRLFILVSVIAVTAVLGLIVLAIGMAHSAGRL